MSALCATGVGRRQMLPAIITMATAYFDNNIFVAIEEGYLNLDQIIQGIDRTIDTVFYSASHLQEAREIKGKKKERTERISRRIETLAEITKNHYLYEKLPSRQVIATTEHPKTVLETIQDISWANWFIKFFVNFVSQKRRNEYRQLLSLNPSELNNYKPGDVLEQLNKKLKDYGSSNISVGR